MIQVRKEDQNLGLQKVLGKESEVLPAVVQAVRKVPVVLGLDKAVHLLLQAVLDVRRML